MKKFKFTRKNLLERLEGDKVVWIIVLMLILISIVCIFSSTSRLLEPGQTRIDMVWNQMKIVMAGLVVIFICYFIRSIELFKWISRWLFLVSLALLIFLLAGPRSGFIRSVELNGARRALMVGGMQFFVFEAIKVMMVLYLAWATDAIRRGDKLHLVEMVNRLKGNNKSWLNRKWAKNLVYIYGPFILTCVLILPGSTTAALFCGFIMLLTILLGGGRFKDILLLMLAGISALALCYGIYTLTDGKVFGRLGTATSGSRTTSIEEMERRYREAEGQKAKQKELDFLRQPYSARIAVKEGGLLGKGPGQSTQRYIVPDMSEDYMFSFIIEEYGIWGALIVIFLYVSLLARGSIIARNCTDDRYAKTTVAGLILMISLQAFLHMFVNAGIGPMTGQTLPLISHGNSAFLCFCAAFGIILSFSRVAQRRIEQEAKNEGSLISVDEVSSGLDELDAFESENKD